MAIYRNIQMSFWTDSKIAEEFSTDEKLLYLYLLTNPHTNLCGCYELGIRQMAFETGFQTAQAKKLLVQLEEKKVISYSEETKEVLLINWSKYNWTKSEKFQKPLIAEIKRVKHKPYRDVLERVVYGIDTVSDEGGYPIDTTVLFCSDTDTVTDTVTDSDLETKKSKEKPSKEGKKKADPIKDSDMSEPMKDKVREWMKYKAERGETYKPTGLQTLINRISREEKVHGAIAVMRLIDDSMSNGWRGIIWDRLGKPAYGDIPTRPLTGFDALIAMEEAAGE